jgi:hypothetical protein
MASGRSLSIAAKELSNSPLLLILIGLIAVPVASPASVTAELAGKSVQLIRDMLPDGRACGNLVDAVGHKTPCVTGGCDPPRRHRPT